MTRTLRRFRPCRPGPALACCALALLAAALHSPAAAAVPAGVPLAWGANNAGQLGNGTFSNGALPMPVPNLTGVVAVAGDGYSSMALKADGTVWAWGSNDQGQLGDGTFTSRTTPVRVANLSGITAIDTGALYSLALRSDHTVWAWGDNTLGQLGLGTVGGYRNTPAQVPNLSGVVAISGGGGGTAASFSLALKLDGSVWSWGLNDRGQCGDGTFINRSSPVRVTNPADPSGYLNGISAIAAGGAFGMALTPAGTVWTWGNNKGGQLGNGTFNPDPPYGIPTPALVPSLSEIVALAPDNAGWATVLRADGTVWTWGNNGVGQLGQGTITPSPPGGIATPGQVLNPDWTVFDGVAALGPGLMAVRTDGSVWAWAFNAYGELGIGTTGPPVTTPVQVPGLVGPAALARGNDHRLAVRLEADYSWSGFLQPLNGDGTSVFKKASTVQLKFRLTDDQGASISNAQAQFSFVQLDGSDPGAVNESVSNAAGTPGNLFVYDAASGEYRYNWRTTGLGRGRYLLRVDLADGPLAAVTAGLK